jgi:hypothetical protein
MADKESRLSPSAGSIRGAQTEQNRGFDDLFISSRGNSYYFLADVIYPLRFPWDDEFCLNIFPMFIYSLPLWPTHSFTYPKSTGLHTSTTCSHFFG